MSCSSPPTEDVLETNLSGFDLLNYPMLNKGTAFTEAERTEFALHGLLPPHVGTMEAQIARRLKALRRYRSGFQRYAFLRDLQDTNETLFHALLQRHIDEMLPIVYTPTVGEGCERFSEIWRKPRGLFLSYPNRHRIPSILAHARCDKVRAIVVSDGERILGLGDQGAGGMGIPIGKLALYTACAGIHPELTLPIFLDAGTDNVERRNDPLYIGWRQERVRGAEYDEFVDTFVKAVIERWPNVLLQWEDFAQINSSRLLERYRDQLCTFNDDIQGTAAVAAGTLLSAINVTGVPMAQQRIAVFGAGSAGIGICTLLLTAMKEAGLSETEARARFFAVDQSGLLIEGMHGLRDVQLPFVQTRGAIAHWQLSGTHIGLLDVMNNAKATALIGVSGQSGAFTEEIVRAMARGTERPVIFPLSNPTSRSEAVPADLMRWTENRAVIGTGSPFPGVTQTNNSYIFPGVGLGVLAVNARRVTDAMFMAAAKTLAELSPARQNAAAKLLPPVKELRAVSSAVAFAVAKQAQIDSVGDLCGEEALKARIHDQVWVPIYKTYRLSNVPAS